MTKIIKNSYLYLLDAEAYCRKNVKIVTENLNRHLVTAYSIREKQVARDNIKSRTSQPSDCDVLL